MKKFLIIVITCLFCISCGVKEDPEYKSWIDHNKDIYLV